MVNRKSMLTACGVAIMGMVMAVSVAAWGDGSQTTYLTFSRPFALPGVTLPAGTYIFELANPNASPDIVQVLSRDRQRAYLMAFTRSIQRPQDMRSDSQVTFGEVPSGMTPPITAWYPIAEAVGHQFVYPENSRQLTGRVGN